MEFWQELLLKIPDLTKLHELSRKINSAITSTSEAFRKLLKLSDMSPQVLRMFASFCLEVSNDLDRGQELLTKAQVFHLDLAFVHAYVSARVPIIRTTLSEC